jgi:hypothetical protein
MHQEKYCALVILHTLKINKNIITYYSRIRKFDKEKTLWNLEKLKLNNK